MSASVTELRVDYTARCPDCGKDTTFTSVGKPVQVSMFVPPSTRFDRIEVACGCGDAA